jgi:GT2 family glycosyltransferase
MGRTSLKGYGFTWTDATLRMSWLDWQDNHPHDAPFLCGCFVAVRADAFSDAGGFDEGLHVWGSEDAELSLRLWLLGYECRVVPRAEVAHMFRTRFPYSVDNAMTVHNTLRLAATHLTERAVARVVAALARSPAFPRAYAALADSDLSRRRARLAQRRTRDGQWFLDRFAIDALA